LPGKNETVTIETAGELSPLLGWLATLPVREVRIEPLGLQAVYEQYHPAENAA
jgi:ABC-2 type transport system ATP-binding protein